MNNSTRTAKHNKGDGFGAKKMHCQLRLRSVRVSTVVFIGTAVLATLVIAPTISGGPTMDPYADDTEGDPASSSTLTPTPTPTPTQHNTSHASSSSAHVPWSWVLFIFVGLVMAIVFIRGVMFVRDAHASRRLARAHRRDVETAWKGLHKRLETITTRWDAYESDPALFLTQPAIRDVSVPEVASAIRALMDARSRRRDLPATDVDDVTDTPYYDAVARAEVCVETAIRVTRDMVRTRMNAAERRLLTEAQQMLALTLNSAATDAERHAAYTRLRRLLDQLDITMPETTRNVIEHQHLQQIEA